MNDRWWNTAEGAVIGRAGLVVAVVAGIAVPGPAAAQRPAALVEAVDAPGATVAFMDYVVRGRVIDLGGSGTLKLGYLKSCLSETIVGGRVVVGLSRSEVRGGTVERQRVECDGGRLKLSAEELAKSAILVLRRPPPGRARWMVRPTFKIYGASPLIRLVGSTVGAGKVVIERLDRPGDDVEVALDGGRADFAAMGRALEPGGIYRARSAKRSVVFEVDPLARPGPGPIIGRLVEF